MSLILCEQCYTTYYAPLQTPPTTFADAPAYVYWRLCNICGHISYTKQFELQINGDTPKHVCYGVDTAPELMRLDYVGWSNLRGEKGFMCRGCGKAYWCDINALPREPGALREVEPNEEKIFAELFGRHKRDNNIEETLNAIHLKRMGGDIAMIQVRYDEVTGQMITSDDGAGVSAPPVTPSHTCAVIPPSVPVQEALAAPPTSVQPAEVPPAQPLPVKADITQENLHVARQLLQQVIMLSGGIDNAVKIRQQIRDTIALFTCPYAVRDIITRGDGPQDTVVVVSVVGGDADLEYYKIFGRVYNTKTHRLGKKEFRVRTLEYQWKMCAEKFEGRLEVADKAE